jgi:Predicted membrane protein (DUF2306)
MNAHVLTAQRRSNSSAQTALKVTAQFWFVVAFVGQLLFAYYVLAYYGGAAIEGSWEKWNKVFKHGYVAGDAMGNIAVGVHLFLAFVVTVCGPLQLISQIRTYAPTFHRWNGRIYLTTAVVTSIAGLVMLFNRGSVGGTIQHVGIALNAVLVIIFAALALRYALARDFVTHRRWALRLFLVVSGVWFYRIGLMLWLVVNKGPAGFDPVTFQGPFLYFIAFANYLLPLAVLEIYFYAKDKTGALGHFTMAAGLFVLTLAMAAGILFATKLMWFSRL